MKVILLSDIAKVGKRYEVKDVSSGHALNFLIPQGLALSATRDAMKRVEVDKARHEGEKRVQNELLAKNLEGVDGITLTVSEKANEKGHLFAGIHREEIAKALSKNNHIELDPSWIVLEHPIKEVGEYDIKVEKEAKLATFKLEVKSK